MSDKAHWVEVYEYCRKIARMAFPYDGDAADEAAADCFARFLKIYGETGLTKWQNWVGRSIAGLKKNMLRTQWNFRLTNDETDDVIERIRSPQIGADVLFDVAKWREMIEVLEEPERGAFRIISDGGTIKDIMEDMRIGPREALYIVASGRKLLHELMEQRAFWLVPLRRAERRIAA